MEAITWAPDGTVTAVRAWEAMEDQAPTGVPGLPAAGGRQQVAVRVMAAGFVAFTAGLVVVALAVLP